MNRPLVRLSGITKSFSEVPANNSVDFTLYPGSVHGLLGENGAGKTTLMNILFGLYRPDSGKIFLREKETSIHSPLDAMKAGIGMVHQHFMLVRTLTVTENIMLGVPSSKFPFLDSRRVRDDIVRLSEVYRLNVDPDAPVSGLSVGEQQRVEILTALFQGADILILDEPTAVLTPGESEDLFSILRTLRDDGKGIVLISHKLEEILSIADEVTILRSGVVTGRTTVTADTTKKELTRMMVGRDVLFDFSGKKAPTGGVVLEISGLKARDDRGLSALDGVSLDVREGEILGLAGVDGNGQKELCQVITGVRESESGTMVFDGINLVPLSPKERIRAGVRHIPEDRQRSGLVMNWDIRRNLILKNYDSPKISGPLLLKAARIREQADEMIAAYAIKTQGGEEPVRNLSGGNQQKVILAREMGENPRLLIAEHPTRGLDIGATEYVRRCLLDRKAAGAAVLMVSADLEEIFQISDRIAVMYNGRILGVVKPEEGRNRVGMLMAGITDTNEDDRKRTAGTSADAPSKSGRAAGNELNPGEPEGELR